MKPTILSIIALAALGSAVHADTHDPDHAGGTVSSSEAGVGKVVTHGAFRRFMHLGDFGTKVTLSDLPESSGLYGLGAVTGLEGEITLLDGQRMVSIGAAPRSRLDSKAASSVGAALLVTAVVPSWTEIPVTRNIDGNEIEEFILEQARKVAVSDSTSFAFMVKGRLGPHKAHVLNGANAEFKGHGSGVPMARKVLEAAASADGTVLGFVASNSDIGIISHPGERVHAHFIPADGAWTSHLDEFSIAAGAVLLLPSRMASPRSRHAELER